MSQAGYDAARYAGVFIEADLEDDAQRTRYVHHADAQLLCALHGHMLIFFPLHMHDMRQAHMELQDSVYLLDLASIGKQWRRAEASCAHIPPQRHATTWPEGRLQGSDTCALPPLRKEDGR